MLSILASQTKRDTDIRLYVLIVIIIYIVLHYIIFSIQLLERFKYVFYSIVLIDVFYFYRIYKKRFEIKELEINDNNEVPQMFIEKPYIEDYNHNAFNHYGLYPMVPHIYDQKKEEPKEKPKEKEKERIKKEEQN